MKGDSASAIVSPSDTSNIAADTTKKDGDLLSKMGKDTTQKDTSKAGQKTFEEFSKENPLFAYLIPADFQVQTQDQKNSVDKMPIIGFTLTKDTSLVNSIFNRPDIRSLLPKNFRGLWTVKPRTKDSQTLEMIGIKITTRNGEAPLDGKVITNANKDVSQFKNSCY